MFPLLTKTSPNPGTSPHFSVAIPRGVHSEGSYIAPLGHTNGHEYILDWELWRFHMLTVGSLWTKSLSYWVCIYYWTTNCCGYKDILIKEQPSRNKLFNPWITNDQYNMETYWYWGLFKTKVYTNLKWLNHYTVHWTF